MKFPLVALATSATSVLRFAGHSTGCVVELTATRSIVVPVYENQVVHHAIKRFEKVTGDVLDDYMSALMVGNERITGDTSCLKECAVQMKEQFCFVSDNYDEDVKAIQNGEYDLTQVYVRPPETRGAAGAVESVSANQELIMCPEAL